MVLNVSKAPHNLTKVKCFLHLTSLGNCGQHTLFLVVNTLFNHLLIVLAPSSWVKDWWTSLWHLGLYLEWNQIALLNILGTPRNIVMFFCFPAIGGQCVKRNGRLEDSHSKLRVHICNLKASKYTLKNICSCNHSDEQSQGWSGCLQLNWEHWSGNNRILKIDMCICWRTFMRSRPLILKFWYVDFVSKSILVCLGSGNTTSTKGKVDLFVLIDSRNRATVRVIWVMETYATG